VDYSSVMGNMLFLYLVGELLGVDDAIIYVN
jgi:hypothetical protein